MLYCRKGRILWCFFFLPNKHTHKHLPDIIEMPSPLRQVAWECGECATTNRGTEQLPCSYCRAKNPRRYEILAGSALAATARTVQVMRTEQHDIVQAASEARVAVVPRPVVDHALLAERLRGTLIDIVGTESSENGRADDYDGMYARVVEVYSPRSLSVVKQQKRHRNLGCCVAKILGNAPVRSL